MTLPADTYLHANCTEPASGRSFAFYVEPIGSFRHSEKASFSFEVNGYTGKETQVQLVPFEPTQIINRPEKWIIGFADQGAQHHRNFENDYLKNVLTQV